ncbi:nicotinate-nucleotide--dimethylbenzimidazole phosphoribosyltransferase [Heliophilum fasciatum]|uniref:Nicotinate-nucleotide--dimethylbenzimidazole phosphoribosyltransferase n=1 Tax=Heliophilum fasciatum TaxID=35700 RepID=A0A4R2RUQ7_9FIRM|nr:nicotinate-nucleotide--dimethylbenzimidazole phosphoribosyltransferase [Heliophilum fasciatum]MCW2277296.1 nicotinate-nucleotide--dimethylbenzimidazole phosphoribosyltransferase [Heliophilum fasciatum]TCP67133.1 nicotinate-nucleotide-dimethylbenzimidazole phosphoribosyltransferase [Heliophilum fasciatum]
MTITQLLNRIKPLDQEQMAETQAYLDTLTKPIGSLGVLEDMACQLTAIYQDPRPPIPAKALIIMIGDHGVAAEGISAFPPEVTTQMTMNYSSGGAGANVMARHAGAEVVCVDIGVAVDLPDMPRLIKRKIAYGTQNMTQGPAMTREQAEKAILTGADIVAELVRCGVGMVATGEMGIANTTAAAAIIAAIKGESAERVVGRGSGIDDSRLQRKITIVNQALTVNKPNPQDPIDILAKVGGLEIAGLVGVILGAAAERVPVVVDGFISTAAAVIAASLSPDCKAYMIGSHLSIEPGHQHMLSYLGLEAMLHMRFRLGEGTGACLAMIMADAALKMLHEMATFESAGVAISISRPSETQKAKDIPWGHL